MGVTLAYDGQTDRAAKFFDRAADLAGVAGGHIAVFEPMPAAVPAERKASAVPVSAEIEIYADHSPFVGPANRAGP